MSGIGLGCMMAHGTHDHRSELLRNNQHGLVLCRDLCDDQAKGELHVLGGQASTLVEGFPCQLHSVQGLQRGSADPRHRVITEILRTAYLHMVQCLILECTPQAQYDCGVRQELEFIAQFMGWTIHGFTLALSHQLPCRRHGWWVLLCPAEWRTASVQTDSRRWIPSCRAWGFAVMTTSKNCN